MKCSSHFVIYSSLTIAANTLALARSPGHILTITNNVMLIKCFITSILLISGMTLYVSCFILFVSKYNCFIVIVTVIFCCLSPFVMEMCLDVTRSRCSLPKTATFLSACHCSYTIFMMNFYL